MMRPLFLVLFVAMLCGCPSGPRPILSDQPQLAGSYRYIAVPKGSDDAVTIETMMDRRDIVSRYADHGRVAYVVHDDESPIFGKVPFSTLEKATLTLEVRRVSDINGWGEEVNGEVHAARTLRADFDRAELAQAFELLQRLELDPWKTIEQTWPGNLDEVATRHQVALFENGFVIELDAVLTTGNPFDAETRVTLYGTSKRSGYFAAG